MLHTAFRELRFRRLALILWLALASAPAAAQEGFSSYAGELARIRLPMDGADIVPVEVGELNVAGRLAAMALGPDGRLYAASWDRTNRLSQLYVVDPESAAATPVGELDHPSHSPWDMTFDDEGRLWLLARSLSPPHVWAVYQVDPATAATTENLTGLIDLQALASHAGQLYGIVGEAWGSEYSLVSIDPATGDLTPVVELTGFEPDHPWCEMIPHDMDFDVEGRLWVAASWYQACIITPYVGTGIHFYADPLDGTLTSRSSVADGIYLILLDSAFAVREPSHPVVDVPTLGFGGALILAAALAAAALAAVGRRS